jgi:hypothetical protein
MRRRSWIAIVTIGVIVAVALSAVWAPPWGYGWHDWDQMESHRYLADKTLRLFKQFPFWDPYGCGGHTWWAGPESGTAIVPWLPVYLLFPLAVAIRIEITIVTLAGAAGSWLLARRFTESVGAQVLVVCAFVLNARFAMQLAMGHVWHLYYAGLPWALYFFDRGVASDRKVPTGDILGLAITTALLIYAGAIYPLPQTALILTVVAVTLAVSQRSWRPLAILGASGAVGVGLAAPRLFPLLAELGRFPRVVRSDENIDAIRFIALFTRKASDPHPDVTPWGWHEFGIYIGWVPLMLMLGSLFVFRKPRERALAYAGLLCLLLGFGRLSSFAPWGLLHDYVPVFQSQHVPTRWLFPAVLLLLLVAAASAERWLDGRAWRPRFEVACWLVCAALSLDIALEARRALVGTLARAAPSAAESVALYHQENDVPRELSYDQPDWAPPGLPAMRANVGLIQCATFHEQAYEYAGSQQWKLLRGSSSAGVHGHGDPEYRGETYFVHGTGQASIATWSPNAVVVRYTGANAGDVLVLNQNWDPGWHATGHDVIDDHGLVAVRVSSEQGDIAFRYASPFVWLGLMVLIATVLGVTAGARRARIPCCAPARRPRT